MTGGAQLVAVVTGAASGIGLVVAGQLLEAGYSVALVDRSPRVIDQAQRLGDNAGVAFGIVWDLLDLSVGDPVSVAIEKCGRVDVLVNAAAISPGGSVLDASVAAWSATFAVNLTAPFLLSQVFARALVARRCPGVIVNVASVNAISAERDAAAYVASKGGLVALTRSMAVDLAPWQIRVNAVLPGPIRTPATEAAFAHEPLRTNLTKVVPAGRVGTAAEVAEAVTFLCSDRSSFITGTSLVVDGGMLSYACLD